MAARRQAVQRLIQAAEQQLTSANVAVKGCSLQTTRKHAAVAQPGNATPPPPAPPPAPPPPSGSKPTTAPEGSSTDTAAAKPSKGSKRRGSGFGTALITVALPAAAYIAYQEYPDEINSQLTSLGVPPLPPIPENMKLKLPDQAAVQEGLGKLNQLGADASVAVSKAGEAVSKAVEVVSKLPEQMPNMPNLPNMPDWGELQKKIGEVIPLPGWTSKAPTEKTKAADSQDAQPISSVMRETAAGDGGTTSPDATATVVVPEGTTGSEATATAVVSEGTTSSPAAEGALDSQLPLQEAASEKVVEVPTPSPDPSAAQEASAASADASTAAAPEAVEQSTAPAPSGPAGMLAAAAKEAPPFPPGLLGLSSDLSRAGLVRSAMERGYGAGGDWGAYDAQLRQATNDAAVFAEAMHQALAFHEQSLAKVKVEADKQASRAAELEQYLEETNARWKLLLQQQQLAADDMARQAVRSAELRTRADISEALNNERVARGEALDALRLKLASLSAAFEQRSDEGRTSTEAHAIGLATAAMTAALQAGKPVGPLLQILNQSPASSDPVVAAALESLPAEVVRSGVATSEQLRDDFQRLKHRARELSYFPEGKVGLLATLFARLAANLKADEREAVRAIGVEEAGVDGHLALAEQRLVAGDLTGAAAALESGLAGSMAAHAVASWVKAARARAVADQTIALLQAHGITLAASLA